MTFELPGLFLWHVILLTEESIASQTGGSHPARVIYTLQVSKVNKATALKLHWKKTCRLPTNTWLGNYIFFALT